MTEEYRLHSDDGTTKEYRKPCNHSRFMWCENCGLVFHKCPDKPTPEQLKRADAAIARAIKDFEELLENE